MRFYIPATITSNNVDKKCIIMQTEIWKDIPEYEGYYQVSNLGRVKGLSRFVNPKSGGKYRLKANLLKPIKKGIQDYFVVGLSKNGITKIKTIHQIVAITFLNHKPCGFKIVVDHINNIKTDNRLINLQLTTTRHNSSKDQKPKSGESCIYNVGEKFMVRLRINGKKKSLGTYKKIEEAIIVRDNFLKESI